MLVGETACIVTAQLHFVSSTELPNYIVAEGEYLKKSNNCGLAEDECMKNL